MPSPLSEIRMRVRPAESKSIWMEVAPASSEFSTSSLTTLAGRSTTSPAAIKRMRDSGSFWILPKLNEHGLRKDAGFFLFLAEGPEGASLETEVAIALGETILADVVRLM